MKIKAYISIFLAFVFIAKFIAIDANGLDVFFSGKGFTFVKVYCEKKNPSEQSDKTVHFSKEDLNPFQMVSLSGFCTSQFQLELFSWETSLPKPDAVLSIHFTSNLNDRFLENHSPPPRWV